MCVCAGKWANERVSYTKHTRNQPKSVSNTYAILCCATTLTDMNERSHGYIHYAAIETSCNAGRSDGGTVDRRLMATHMRHTDAHTHTLNKCVAFCLELLNSVVKRNYSRTFLEFGVRCERRQSFELFEFIKWQ